MTQERTSAETCAGRGQSGCACMGAGPMISDMFKKLGPDEEVRQHFRNARIEFLKGIREMIDRRIGELSKQTQQRGAKVVVE